MAEQLLQNNETGPVIDREQLLKDSQNKEFDKLMLSLESDRYTLFDLQDIIIQIGKNNPQAQPYIEDFIASRTSKLQQVLMENRDDNKTEVKVGPHKTEAKKSPEKQEKPNITLTPENQKQLVKSGETELKTKEQELKQIDQKLIQVDLIRNVASMYKEYLQSIKEAIQFKMLTGKDERYEKQIGVIGEKVTLLTNLETFLARLQNFDEVKKLDLKDLVNQMFVSEKVISEDGFMEQPLINGILYHEATTKGVNETYAEIRKLLLTPNLTPSKAEEIKLQIFSKIRQIDRLGADDNNLILDTKEAISSRITGNVLNNKELRKRTDINTTFSLLENFDETKKKGLFDSLKGGKEQLKTFLTNSKVLDKLGLKSEKDKNEFIKDLYEDLKESLKVLDNDKLKKSLEDEVNKQFDYLKARIPESEKEKLENERKKALNPKNLQEQLEKVKQEMVFSLFEKTIINQVLENNSKFVENLAKKDTALNLYADIEGIGSKVSDKNFNGISSFSKTLVEQIAIMYVSGFVGGIIAKGGGLLLGKVAPATINTNRFVKAGTGVLVEGTGFYGTYTALNGILNRENIGDIKKDYNYYDLTRTIAFLGVLRIMPLDKLKESFNIKSPILNEAKNITLDTGALLGTDIIIRGSLGEIVGREGIPKDVDGNYTWEKFGEFVGDELKFIVPLIIGLRQSDKAVASLFEKSPPPKITVIPKENEFIIQIEGLKKEIRALRQERNIARNKGKSHKEVSEELKTKKKEYKTLRDENADLLAKSGTGNTDTPTAVLPNQNQVQNSKDNSKQAKDQNFPKESTNLNTGVKTIQETLKGKNIEDLMKGFEGMNLTGRFQELLKNGGDRTKAQELIDSEVDTYVAILKERGVFVDEIEGNRFIKEFKEQRLAEFDKLVEMIGEGKDISGGIDMKVKVEGREFVWRLELKDVKMMREFFEKYIEKRKIQEKQKESDESNI
ncbi:MAG: hypothetical protein PHV23_01370 [Candidatus Gracilibacteria bacterium]|nr:hypothetical protein [Candidatus Gracilibacteria bacterium]